MGRFAQSDILFPEAYKLYSASAKLQLSYEVLAVGHIEIAGDKFPFPKEAIYTRFLNGTRTSERRITVESVKLESAVAKEAFDFDPSSADYIYDEDQRIMIRTPK